jgi:hypothetical protein
VLCVYFNLVGRNDHDGRDENELWYFKRFNFGHVNLRQFFTDDVAIVCLEISYYISNSDQDLPAIDLDFRRNLWQDREMGLSDLTLKVGDKEIKVSHFNKHN